MKKLLLVLVILAIAISFLACGPKITIVVESPEGGEGYFEGETMDIDFTVRSADITEVKIELYNGETKVQDIMASYAVSDVNTTLSATWTVADLDFSETYKIVITDTANAENTDESGEFSIGADPNKAVIMFYGGVSFTGATGYIFELYMSTDDDMIAPDQDYQGSIGVVDWGYNLAEFETYMVEDNVYSQISAEGTSGDLPTSDKFAIESDIYDWGISLNTPAQPYHGQFVTSFTELNDRYEFQAGETYNIGPQFPFGLECVQEGNTITMTNFTPATAALGDTSVEVTITGTNFAGTPTVRLAAFSLDDDEVVASSVTVDSATQITATFDIPSTVPYTGETQTYDGGSLNVNWYLQVIQDGGYARYAQGFDTEFTINQ